MFAGLAVAFCLGLEGLTRVWSPECAVQGGRDGESLGTFSTHPRLGSSPVLGWWALGQLLVISDNEKLVAGKQVGPGREREIEEQRVDQT